MIQPKPPLTPQTLSNSWCHSSESTSLMESLGQTDALAVDRIVEWQMDSKDSVMDPTTAQHLAQKSGGPFDTEIPDVTVMESHVASAENDAILMTPTKDLSNEFDLDSLLQSDGLGETSDDMTNKNVDDFVDLFDFLLQNDKAKTLPIDELLRENTSGSTDGDASVGKKRSHDASNDSPTVPSDHVGYIKIKHKKLEDSVPSLTSDTESETGSNFGVNDKHVIRRLKNNVASRRSRQTRKQKYVDMEKKAAELEAANVELRERVTMLEKLAKDMKDELIKCMTK